MLITKELIMTLLIVLGVGKYSESKAPKYYEIITEQGKSYNIQIDKEQKYACPLHCGADHYHKTLILDGDIKGAFNFYNIENFEGENSNLNSYAVIDTEEIIIDTGKKQQELKKLNVQTYLP
jgi:hypothetical protein